MALIENGLLFPREQHYVAPMVPVPPMEYRPGIAWKPVLLTAAGAGLLLLLVNALSDELPERQCGICGKTGHDSRRCPKDSSRRVPLRMTKTGRCSCCNRRASKTVGHHYAGPADGTKGREMCIRCHLHCGHGGDWQNMPINPQYCRRH